MTFLTSILLGLCMGSGVAFSIYYGKKDSVRLKNSIFLAFCMIGGIALLITAIVFAGIDPILCLLQVPTDIYGVMREYLWMIFWGILATFLYNFFSCLLRAEGNSVVPLVFLGISAVLNIGLDLLFVVVLKRGVQGAAEATVISQYVSGAGLLIYTLLFFREFCPRREDMRWRQEILKEILHLSSMTCIQQSVMNFGILMVQGLVNSFGSVVMAAFSVAVKIDSFAYMPVQDFGNAFSTFVAQITEPERKSGFRGHPKRGADIVPFQCRSQRIGCPVCKTADVDLCQAGGSGDTKCRDPVSADRGKFLLSDRISVPVVRVFPGSQTSGDFPCTDRDLPRNACGARLYSLGK